MKTLTISNEVWEKIKDTVNEDSSSYQIDSLSDFIGKKLFIRTVTYHLTGEVDKIVGKLFHLKTASWVADSGKFSEAIKNGTLSEVEYVGEAWVNIDTIVDIFPWNHKLPKETK